jgi:AcrR family transcriptional regulator
MAGYSAGESTKMSMVNAAGELAGEVGLDNVTTRAVAERAGENIGSIHYHFGGKDGLFEAVARNAIGSCEEKKVYEAVEQLDESSTPEEFSKAIRIAVAGEIDDLFRSDRPHWHSQVIYQLLQRDDDLYELLRVKLLDPSMDCMVRLLKLIDPAMSDEDAFLHACTTRMPVFAHAHYMKAMLKRLGVKQYSERYLKKMEDLLVQKAQRSLGLPED